MSATFYSTLSTYLPLSLFLSNGKVTRMSLASKMTGNRLDGLIGITAAAGIFHFTTTSKPVLGPKKSPIQRLHGSIS